MTGYPYFITKDRRKHIYVALYCLLFPFIGSFSPRRLDTGQAHLVKSFYNITLVNTIRNSLVLTLSTLVIPMAPVFTLYVVVPFPLPNAPVKRHPIPSIPIPRLIACFGGGGAPDNLAQAKYSPTDSIMEASTPASIPNTPAALTVGIPH